MSNNMNKVIIQGNLTKDPECSDTGETRLCKLVLASNRSYKEKDETCFVGCQCWGGINKIVEPYLVKGSAVLLEGRLKLESWESKEGESRHRHVVVVESLVMLPKGEKKSQG